jgi:hypothetical protein
MNQEKQYFFYNCMLEWQQARDGVDGCLAASEVVQTIFDADFRENGLILQNPKTDYYHKYPKPPQDGMFLIKVAKPASEMTIDVVVDTRLYPNFVMIEKIDSMLEQCCDVKRAVEFSLNKAAGKFGWSAKLKENQLNVVHDFYKFVTAMEYAGNTDMVRRMYKGQTIIINSPGNQITQTENNYYGTVNQCQAETGNDGFSDEQIAKALVACVGKDKVINAKWKWAGAYWYLRWACNYPVDPQKFCEKIAALKMMLPENCECSYESIRKICNLSFMEYDATKMDSVKVSKNDNETYAQCREVALKLAEELGKTYLQTG